MGITINYDLYVLQPISNHLTVDAYFWYSFCGSVLRISCRGNALRYYMWIRENFESSFKLLCLFFRLIQLRGILMFHIDLASRNIVRMHYKTI